MSDAREPLAAGTELSQGAYVIESLLGAGGFSLTYKGIETRLKTPVAIKEFFPKGCTRQESHITPGGSWRLDTLQESMDAFLDEGRTMERFERPGIVKVYSVFQANGTAYIVMELLRGSSFQKLIQERGVVPEHLALGFISDLGCTLDGIHLAGLLHGDIKPENIVLTEDDRVILLDFGAARSYLSHGSDRGDSVTLTPGYAPPEQYRADEPIDPSTDVYALAATLYHLLTGHRPPTASDRIKGKQVPSVKSFVPTVSASTENAIREGLKLGQATRPSSIRAFLGLLLSPGEADKVLALNTGDIKIHREHAVLSGPTGWVLSVAFTPDGTRLATGDQDGKVWLWSVQDRKPLGVLSLTGPVTDVKVSSDGKVLACATQTGDVILFDLGTGREVGRLKTGPPPVGAIGFTSDNRRLISCQTDGSCIIYEPPGKMVSRLTGHSSPVNSVCCSPGGRLAATASNDRTARLWDLKSGRAIRVLAGHTRVVQCVRFSPDGRLVATGSTDFTIRLWDVREGKEVRKLKGHEAMVWEVIFLPGGDRILSSSGDKTVRIWSLDTAREVERFEGHESWVRGLDYNSAAGLVATGGGDNTIRLWEMP